MWERLFWEIIPWCPSEKSCRAETLSMWWVWENLLCQVLSHFTWGNSYMKAIPETQHWEDFSEMPDLPEYKKIHTRVTLWMQGKLRYFPLILTFVSFKTYPEEKSFKCSEYRKIIYYQCSLIFHEKKGSMNEKLKSLLEKRSHYTSHKMKPLGTTNIFDRLS